MVWTGGSSKRFCTCVANQPMARPTQIPPAATRRNSKLACVSENAPVMTAATAKRKEIKEVASTGAFSLDRKSTRLNSSHVSISYAVFCLKKKKKKKYKCAIRYMK